MDTSINIRVSTKANELSKRLKNPNTFLGCSIGLNAPGTAPERLREINFVELTGTAVPRSDCRKG